MILTERLTIEPLSYEGLCEYVRTRQGEINSDEAAKKFTDYTLIPMSVAPPKDHVFYTAWIGRCKGVDVVQVGFLRPPNEHSVVEIWSHVNPEFRGLGYGTEAMRGLIDWVKDKPGVIFVGASISPENTASKHMIYKLGFSYATVVSEMEIFFLQVKF